MRLYAISDLHLASSTNRDALRYLPYYPEDWLIIAGDIGETEEYLDMALSHLTRRFAKVLWTPGNHDLWSITSQGPALRGVAKYEAQVALCRDYGVLTPEDPYIRWPGAGPAYLLAPIFTLYDYSFRPDDVPAEQALAWAEESGVMCTDEALLHPDPYPSRAAWCAARCDYTEQRLQDVADAGPIVLISHFSLRYDLVRLKRIPRFSIWCGTRRAQAWLTRFPVTIVVYGHLHIPATDYREGVRFEEVSLGYPRDWNHEKGMAAYLREILPGPPLPYPEEAGPVFHR